MTHWVGPFWTGDRYRIDPIKWVRRYNVSTNRQQFSCQRLVGVWSYLVYETYLFFWQLRCNWPGLLANSNLNQRESFNQYKHQILILYSKINKIRMIYILQSFIFMLFAWKFKYFALIIRALVKGVLFKRLGILIFIRWFHPDLTTWPTQPKIISML